MSEGRVVLWAFLLWCEACKGVTFFSASLSERMHMRRPLWIFHHSLKPFQIVSLFSAFALLPMFDYTY